MLYFKISYRRDLLNEIISWQCWSYLNVCRESPPPCTFLTLSVWFWQPIAQWVNVSALPQKACLKIILCLSERSNMLSTDGNISLFIIHMQTEDVRGNVSSDGKWKMCTRGKEVGGKCFHLSESFWDFTARSTHTACMFTQLF